MTNLKYHDKVVSLNAENTMSYYDDSSLLDGFPKKNQPAKMFLQLKNVGGKQYLFMTSDLSSILTYPDEIVWVYERPQDAAPVVKQTDEKVGDISVLIKCDDNNASITNNGYQIANFGLTKNCMPTTEQAAKVIEVLKRQLDSIQTVAEQSKSNHISGDGVCTCKIKCDDINIDFALNDAPKHVLNSIKATLSSIIADFYSIFR